MHFWKKKYKILLREFWRKARWAENFSVESWITCSQLFFLNFLWSSCEMLWGILEEPFNLFAGSLDYFCYDFVKQSYRETYKELQMQSWKSYWQTLWRVRGINPGLVILKWLLVFFVLFIWENLRNSWKS